MTGTFLINNHYASVLFDTGADKSFVSIDFRPLIPIQSTKLTDSYEIELADGKLIMTNEILQGCTLHLKDHSFSIDLLPIELGSFDIVVGMDWLSKNQAEIACYDKIVRVPLPKCNKCNYHHNGTCDNFICTKCKKPGHAAKNCRTPSNTSSSTATPIATYGSNRSCFECGATGHFRKDCPKLNQ